MRTVLRSVQEANDIQGNVLKEKQKNELVASEEMITPNLNQRKTKAFASPPDHGKVKKTFKKTHNTYDTKALKKLSFEDGSNKENIPPQNNQSLNSSAQSTTPNNSRRYSKRLAGEDVSEEVKKLLEQNPYLKRELSNAPLVGFPNRFEESPEIVTTVIKHKPDTDSSVAISEKTLADSLKELTNYRTTENFKKIAEKIDTVRICETAEGIPLPKSLSVKMGCCKAVIYAKVPEQHRHHVGEVKYNETVMQKMLKSIEEDKDILSHVKEAPKNPIKEVKDVAITREVLKEWEHRGQEPRSPSQCGAMGISAGDYVQLFGFEDPHTNDGKSNWEWLHLIAFSLGGPGEKLEIETPQDFRNLFAGPAGSNTWMMLPENLVRYLLMDHQDSVEKVFVSASAELFPGTHIAKKINYTIKWTANKSTEEKSLTFKFNPLRYDAPPRIENILRRIVDTELQHKHPGEKVVDEISNQNKVDLSQLPVIVGLDVDFCGKSILKDEELNSIENDSNLKIESLRINV